MERTIGNLGQEIRQPSNPYANLSREGVWHCQVNALKAMVPSLCPEQAPFPLTAIDLGDGYVLLHKRDARPVFPRGRAVSVISHYLGRADSFKIRRWARLRLPNGQIARTAWRELLRQPEEIRPARFIKFVVGQTTHVGEVEYFTRLAVQDENPPITPTWLWKDVAVITMFLPPDPNLLKLSYHTVHVKVGTGMKSSSGRPQSACMITEACSRIAPGASRWGWGWWTSGESVGGGLVGARMFGLLSHAC
ncbi:hypothetical protein PISMIDRAFT_117813 [Pisolithus microcarpus 441]|uniref:Uncharacterized protein n=1 Tax=Pisolithus microcarpus 441 TaxID=765257 RepID=A0A0C9YJL5_9AGAM|nr:hypothetical protein PISMIDRAFT_117813 [Pisolithus microcarpus 441]